MENKTIKTNTKTLLIALFFLVGITGATAQGVWFDPTSSPIGNNIFGPVTDGNEGQEKQGMLITSGIINNVGDFNVLKELSVGFNDTNANISHKTPAYLFGDTYFKKAIIGSNNENQLCVDPEGNVKVCNDVDFKAVQSVYYTNTNVVSFPTSTGVTGYVSYKIGNGQSCTTIATSGTDWAGGQTINATNTNKAVKFNDWGSYDLQMTCAGVTYTANVKIGGKIIPTAVNTSTNYTLNLGANRLAQVITIGAGASGASETGSCVTGYDGGYSLVKIGSSVIAHVSGGSKPTAGIVSGCTPKVGTGGGILANQLSSSFANNGYDGVVSVGGCSGQPDSNKNINTCNSGGQVLPYGMAGSGVDVDGRGGGGGAYLSGVYTLPATGTLTTFVGERGGKGRSSAPYGQNGYVSIIW